MIRALTVLSLLFSKPPAPSGLNITILQPDVPFVPHPHPLPGAASDSKEIIRQFVELDRSTKWKLVEKVKFEGDTYEPEGLVRIGNDRYFVSAGEYIVPTIKYNETINGTDRTAGEGFAHMIVFDGKGKRIADASISKAKSLEYHNGGIDYDGTFIWATLSQYRPNTTGTLLRMRPNTLVPEPILSVADHQGGAVHDTKSGTVVTLNWGSRKASIWNGHDKPLAPPEFTRPKSEVKNPSSFVDYQDCKYLGRYEQQIYGSRPVMLCSGVADLANTRIGGLAIVDMESMAPLHEVPVTLVSDLGAAMTKNPMDVAVVDGKMRLYFLPDERNSTLYVYEAA
ncbi:hypothetical protein B0T20DRAFT_401358 [Sordaria brevicollis]|uniref:Uncharacterized protein n=1 Tax=Sordaria brevicollis TaxID=83679 RepID=A0AAE0PPJ8_SORBR|nr:hypothetical protein B0T20DRAFT_401358 [Sordaria brevicollis]